jgi:hypothetical protein
MWTREEERKMWALIVVVIRDPSETAVIEGVDEDDT